MEFVIVFFQWACRVFEHCFDEQFHVDAWVDTDVDKDEVLIVSEGRVELAGAQRVRLTCERNSMSCMEHGRFFSFTTVCYTTPLNELIRSKNEQDRKS